MNLASEKIVLSASDAEQIDQLDRHRRYYNGTIWTIPRSPYTLATLWDE